MLSVEVILTMMFFSCQSSHIILGALVMWLCSCRPICSSACICTVLEPYFRTYCSRPFPSSQICPNRRWILVVCLIGFSNLFSSWSHMEDNIECCDGIYSFRLFSKKATSNHATSTGGAYQTINLRSPTPHDTNPGFVVQYRPATYYFTGSTAAKSSEQYRQAAVAGEEIIQNLQTQWVYYFHGTFS